MLTSFLECKEQDKFDVELIKLKQPRLCSASLKFLLLHQPDVLVTQLDSGNYYNGIGIIIFNIFYQDGSVEQRAVLFSEFRGVEPDVKKEFHYFVVYAKEYIQEVEQRLGCSISPIIEPDYCIEALTFRNDRWFVAI